MAPISTKFLFFLIKLSLLTEFNEIIVLISFLNLVTSRERSVPPLKIFELGYFFNTLLKFKIVSSCNNLISVINVYWSYIRGYVFIIIFKY